MIHEYAIEPALAVNLAKNRNEFEYYYEKFGLGQPRIMSAFPRLANWRKQFRHAISDATDFEIQRITAFFNLLTERCVCRNGYSYDGNYSWLENSEDENKRIAFHAILALDNPRKNQAVLSSKNIKKDSLWNIEEQNCCPRKASDMATLLKSLLINCQQLYFIDPHFGPENLRHRRPLSAFLFKVIKNPSKVKIKSIEIYTSAKSTEKFFKQECRENLPGIVPSGLEITLKRWKEKTGGPKLHERFILTDIGGVKVGPGLDDGKAGEDFEVMLLKRNLFEKHWKDYVENPAFDLAEEPIVINGSA